MMPSTYLSNLLDVETYTINSPRVLVISLLDPNPHTYIHNYLYHELDLGLIVLVSLYTRDPYGLRAILFDLSIRK
jgi:hypothetical protein